MAFILEIVKNSSLKALYLETSVHVIEQYFRKGLKKGGKEVDVVDDEGL